MANEDNLNTPDTGTSVDKKAGAGLDIGTAFVVGARLKPKEKELLLKKVRCAFVELSLESLGILKMKNIPYLKKEDSVLIIGDEAVKIPRAFFTRGDDLDFMELRVRRPLSNGVISPREADALNVLGVIIKQILGQPLVDKEKVYFSVPGIPIDNPHVNIDYHTGSFITLLEKLGYIGTPINEAYSIIHSEGEEYGYTCVAISWGAGLTNVGMANEIWEIESFRFSVSRGGDYIDRGVSDSLRIPITRVILEKEGDRTKEIPRIDLTNPRNEIQVAIKYFYKSYINYVLDLVISKFFTLKTTVPLPDSIPIICSGGSALPNGFIDLVKEGIMEKRSRLPFDTSEIILAKNPLTSVAKGLRLKLELDEA
jgi:hypothetical protein